MTVKEKTSLLLKRMNEKFKSQFGFYLEETSLPNITEYMYRPTDSSSLAVTRILFGFLMLVDITEERGGSTMDKRWGNPMMCHFPLFPFLKPIPMPYMAFVYAALWIGALGIMLGYKYRITASMFKISYWYLFLIEKSYWNNHSYLFGLVALLLACTDANCYLSIDALKDRTKLKTTVPYWNYFILKYQFFILYFMAGLKKGTAEWLTGYSVQHLSEHWVFTPFKLFLTEPQIDYLIVHWFIFVFDLTVSLWMMYSKTRNVAVFFCCLFHLMNVRLFTIGMFPWVCLATLPLFYPFDWPKTLLNNCEWYHKIKAEILTQTDSELYDYDDIDQCQTINENLITEKPSLEDDNYYIHDISENLERKDKIADIKEIEDSKSEEVMKNNDNVSLENNRKKKFTLCLILVYVITQAFLPYSHFITKGYNNWTDGLYGYSWDMMVHSWDASVAQIIIKDNNTNKTHFLDSTSLTPNDRWTRQGDMAYQYAHCLKEVFMRSEKEIPRKTKEVLSNISIYADVWSSLNGRFSQRLFDKRIDLLKVEWSPFKKMSYVLPLLDDALEWREKMDDLRKLVYSWNNNSDVIFIADFPGYEQSKYVDLDLVNVTLTVLQGVLAYEIEIPNGFTYKLATGDKIRVDPGATHNIYIISKSPTYYMYTFYNTTQAIPKTPPKLAILHELSDRFTKLFYFIFLMWKSTVDVILILAQLMFVFVNLK